MSIKLVNRVGQQYVLPVTFAWPDLPTSWTLPKTDLAEGDGAVLTGQQRLQPKRISLAGVLAGHDRSAVLDQLDQLKAVLAQGPIDCYRHESDDRFLRARVSAIRATPREMDTWVDVRIDLEALDPYWFGAQVLHQRDIATVLDSWTLPVDGNTPTPPVVTFTFGARANLTDPVLEQTATGRAIALLGAYVPGDVVEVDCARTQVVLNGQLALDRLHEHTLINGFALRPGDNLLEFRAEGTVDVTIGLVWRPRWY